MINYILLLDQLFTFLASYFLGVGKKAQLLVRLLGMHNSCLQRSVVEIVIFIYVYNEGVN